MAHDTFSSDWLALREPADHAARAEALVAPIAAWWDSPPGARVIDLGSGTGSNLRWLAPRLGGPHDWWLVDHDPVLLARALELGAADVAGVGRLRPMRGDLDREGLALVRHADLVTASALLDLVSARWLDRLVQVCALAGAAALLALSWDGTIEWRGAPDPDDALVLDALRAHQRRDKGLGPALGPEAAEAAASRFAAASYRIELAPSPWVLGPADRALGLALLDGWAGAAIEQQPPAEARIRAWAERRRRSLEADVTLIVGHVDLLALPSWR